MERHRLIFGWGTNRGIKDLAAPDVIIIVTIEMNCKQKIPNAMTILN